MSQRRQVVMTWSYLHNAGNGPGVQFGMSGSAWSTAFDHRGHDTFVAPSITSFAGEI
jgi:hypothetical protein